MNRPLRISAVVTSHNAFDATGRCLRALHSHCGNALAEVVVVDDGSSPKLVLEMPKTRSIRNDHCRGYQNAVNQGVAESAGDIIILLDCDAYLTNDAASAAKELFEREPGLGAAGFCLCDEDGKRTGSSEPEPTKWSLILGQRIHSQLSGRRYRRHVVYSCAMAIRRKCFEEIGGFDEAFDFLDADIDFSMRLNRSSWQLRTDVPGLTAIHVGGGSPQTTVQRVVRYHRNRYLLLLKHGLLGLPWLVRMLVVLRAGAEWIVATILWIVTRSGRHAQVAESRSLVCAYFVKGWRDDLEQRAY